MKEVNPSFLLRNKKPRLIEQVENELGPEFVDMSEYVAAQFDTGDLEVSDPRIRASNKAVGRWRAQGGKGPKKKVSTDD